MLPPYSALVDDSTSALLFITHHVPLIVFLAKTMPETVHYVSVEFPNYQRDFPIARATSATYPEWTWEKMKRTFSRTPENLLTEHLRERSLLAVKKGRVLFDIIMALTMARYPAWNGVPMQESVYVTKKLQAQRYKDAGYPEDDVLGYPYVLQYADFSGLTMRAAADEILLKASLDDDLLLKSEFFRLKYFERLKNANLAEVDGILIDFRREFFRMFMVEYALYSL